MLDKFFHKTLRIPYSLNIRHQRIVKHAAATYIFIHGIGDNGDMWQNILAKLPKNTNYLAIDLLGFGDSPMPLWATYDAKAQARSLLATYLKLRIASRVVVVGHSLGSLVAVEFAKRYQLLTERLVLCSPPIYDKPTDKLSLTRPALLRWIYRHASANPGVIVTAYGLGKRLKVINHSLSVEQDNVELFVKSLQSSIINQTTIDDISRLHIPITMLYGVFDPLIVPSTLRRIARSNSQISSQSIATSHIIDSVYQRQLLKILDSTVTAK